ncbi:hypothetical protein AVEN_99743-1 [Araneus ventricosus]|uniref:Uncharacterized protein n=1 Tax=Araneus ventricosus TaxID=182803 RepID=A0A4Y2DMG8_ARAVE|nr:hypothetical protein AVEN_99743-1 [Araneus ventricosus]
MSFQSCAWDNGQAYERTFHRSSWCDNGKVTLNGAFLVVPKLCLGTTGQATLKRGILSFQSCAWGQRDRPLKMGHSRSKSLCLENETDTQKTDIVIPSRLGDNGRST